MIFEVQRLGMDFGSFPLTLVLLLAPLEQEPNCDR